MNIRTTFLCLSFITAMTACAPAGYYDSNGEYRSYGKSDSYRHNTAMGSTPPSNAYYDRTYYDNSGRDVTTTTVTYSRPGYYDQNGYYISERDGPRVPEDFFPPRGMCRIWIANRSMDDQPAIESCRGISNRVPAGAYVIYGG